MVTEADNLINRKNFFWLTGVFSQSWSHIVEKIIDVNTCDRILEKGDNRGKSQLVKQKNLC